MWTNTGPTRRGSRNTNRNAATFTPGCGKLSAGGERPLTLQGFPLGLRHSSPGEKWPLPLQDARTNPEPGLREPTIFVRVKSLKIVRVQPVASTKPSPDPERLPPEERQLLPAGLSSGRLSLYPEEGRSPHTKENTQQESREPATVKEPSGMLGITHVESSSSAIPLRGSEFWPPVGRRLPL